MKLKALGGKVIVHPIHEKPVTHTGLIVAPDVTKRRFKQGIVIAKGPLVSGDVDIADHVYFNPYSGDEIALSSGGHYVIIPEEKLVASRTDSNVALMDTQTVKRLLEERKGEMMQKYLDDISATKLVREVFESLHDRVDTITRSEGFEW